MILWNWITSKTGFDNTRTLHTYKHINIILLAPFFAPHFTLVKEALIEIGCVVTSLVIGWLHMAENSFTLTTYVSPFKANTSANWNAVSRQIWRGCHTSVNSGDLNQAPPKQSAVCSTCIIPALPVNCQFIWMACAFGMSATQPILE